MIARPDRHYEPETLRQLLDEALSKHDAEGVESHLSTCEHCRQALQAVAGDDAWWAETVNVLAEDHTRPISRVVDSTTKSFHSGDLAATPIVREIDSSLQWIRPLLEPCADGGFGRIDQYAVQGVIGQGGMGVVLRGTDPQLNRPVAIKVLSPHLAGVGAARARFMREAQSAASIVHPSIVPIYSVVPAARLPYLVMPCVSGGNLQQRIDREGPLEITEVLRIGMQIAEGLSAAHQRGVIHRDIKPANILIEAGNGRVLITDFGLARALDDASLTASGMIAGTPQYMSPEQARGEAIDARSDLFSLGSLLYALSTGRPPFRADSPLAVLKKITESRPRPVHEINERMPIWLDRLISKLMMTNVNDRIATADKAAEILAAANAHVRNPSLFPLPKSLSMAPMKTARMFTCFVLIAGTIGALLVTANQAEMPVNQDQTPINASKSPKFVRILGPRAGEAESTPAAPQPDELTWIDPTFTHEFRSLDLELRSLERSLGNE